MKASRTQRTHNGTTRHDKWYASILLIALWLPFLGGFVLAKMAGLDPFGYQATLGFRTFTWIATITIGGFLICTNIINYRRKRPLVQNPSVYEQKAGPTGFYFPILRSWVVA